MVTTKLKGNDVALAGRVVNVGDKAPVVTSVNSADLSDVKIGGAKGKTQLIIAVPSLDTPVCATETREFNAKASELNSVETIIVSMDLPFASKRFCSTEGIDNLTVTSDFRNKDFSYNYGTLIADGALAGVSARCIFVIDANGIVTYKQLVPEITTEPNYDEALEAAAKA
jgi:thiol peroxidase